jgi:predicted secreted protein
MNKILFLILVLIMAVPAHAGDIQVFRDSSTKIEVELNQEFAIEIDSKPTANYEWQFAKPLDQNILSLISSEYQPGADAGGKHVFVFKAIGQGMTMASLKFSRTGEKDMYPLDSKTFIINVK